MTAWLVAAGVAATAAGVLFARIRGPSIAVRALLALLRAASLVLLIALLLDAPVARARPTPPWVFVDASMSMQRDHADLWKAAWDSVAGASAESTWMFGDTVRRADRRAVPTAAASRLRPVLERTMVSGRPAIVITDGEVDDSSTLDGFVSGSRIIVLPRAAARDAAVAMLEAARAAVSGDSLPIRVTIASGSGGSNAGVLSVLLNERSLGHWPVEAMSPWTERQLDVRVRLVAEGAQGPSVLRAVVTAPGDAESRNDTLATTVELSRAASAVFVSTSPDQDARFAMAVLRGALSLPTRGFLRVAPGNWRHEGALTVATEAEVREAVRTAPIVILHGDTGIFGSPRAATPAPLALMAPPEADEGEWYPVGVPVSPLTAALSALSLDSLPPVSAGPAASGEWTALEARRGREPGRRAVIVGRDTPRREVVISASGFWRWRFRGGAGADAYAALWGGIFDWLAAERADRRGAVPDETLVREGQRIRWRRGSASDSVVRVAIRRIGGASPRTASLVLRFTPGDAIDETDPLPAGIYDVSVPGGRAILAVNASSELLPAPARIRAGGVGHRATVNDARRARSVGALYVLAVLLLCIEWVLRRRAGLR
ncbi:MAG TPA: hypothetical protein VKH19_09875 [Gemmatimonadaceae bacterium]|nr:hypothetical protein [Gemmatimonadaceae bacterium]